MAGLRPSLRLSWREAGHRPTPDHTAADMAHRDDLARDVAREWAEKSRRDIGPPPVGVKLHAALDRLAVAYGEQP